MRTINCRDMLQTREDYIFQYNSLAIHIDIHNSYKLSI